MHDNNTITNTIKKLDKTVTLEVGPQEGHVQVTYSKGSEGENDEDMGIKNMIYYSVRLLRAILDAAEKSTQKAKTEFDTACSTPVRYNTQLTDIYHFGIIMCEVFSCTRVSEYPPEVSTLIDRCREKWGHHTDYNVVESVMKKCTSVDPNNRPKNIGIILEQLPDVLDN